MKSWWLVCYRVAVLGGIVWCVAGRPASIGESNPGEIRTSPTCDDVIGYSGPNDVAIRIGSDGKIASLRLLRSGDTAEHAAAVAADAEFWQQFYGKRTADELLAVDGVSRATLTSLAIVEAVAKRLHGVRWSLRFPDEIGLDEARRVWPNAARLTPTTRRTDVFDAAGERLGGMLRTGPRAESITGYQGPSSVLLWFDRADVALRFAVRRSFDNERYVGWVRDDEFFPEVFVGKHVSALAQLHDVDGVSGATMTSAAIARGVAAACGEYQRREASAAAGWGDAQSFVWRGRDIGLLVAVALALLLTFGRILPRSRLRPWTRVAVLAYLGVLSGDMLSQGLLVGWVENGLPYGSPGVLLLAAAALLVPILTGRQVYCHELCAHGAAQELLRRVPWRRRWPAWLAKLRPLRGALLVAIGLGLALGLALPWHGLEPFGAWAFPLVGTAVAVFCVASLVFSSRYPMAYCRVGCPTGALLDFVRRRGSTDQFRRSDALAGVLALVAVARYAL